VRPSWRSCPSGGSRWSRSPLRAGLPGLKEELRGVSLGSMAQGGKALRFLVEEDGTVGELVSGADLLEREP
jgi:hypothetical protein